MDSLATLVPVLNRPQNVAPLVQSWDDSRTPGILVFIVEQRDHDEMIAVHQAAEKNRLVRCLPVVDAHTWGEKINVAIQTVPAKWYLCAADDVRFHAGWWAHTGELRADDRIMVIGTNDLGNPRVTAGDHTCHPLVRGTYARQPNRDGGPFCPEAITHWGVDDVIVNRAKAEGVWASCLGAVVEHLHPYWQDGVPWDQTYAEGEASANESMKAAREWMETYL